jgi:hypothetical protein
MPAPAYIVDYSGLVVKAAFFLPRLTTPKGGITTAPACKQG